MSKYINNQITLFRFVSLCFCFLFIAINGFPQKGSRFLHTYQYQDYYYMDTDTSRIWYTYNIPNLIIVSMHKTNGEYFEISDTLYRDYILLDNEKYLVDFLMYKNYDEYAMYFEYLYTYYIQHKQIEYLIINGSNGFQMGTEAQPLYMIFQKKGNKYHFLSSYYIEDMGYYDKKILNSVKVIFRGDKMILKGINLKRVR